MPCEQQKPKCYNTTPPLKKHTPQFCVETK